MQTGLYLSPFTSGCDELRLVNTTELPPIGLTNIIEKLELGSTLCQHQLNPKLPPYHSKRSHLQTPDRSGLVETESGAMEIIGIVTKANLCKDNSSNSSNTSEGERSANCISGTGVSCWLGRSRVSCMWSSIWLHATGSSGAGSG